MAISPALRSVAGKATPFRALPVLLVGLALLTGCHKPAVTDPNDPNFVVAGKGDWTITRAQLNNEVDSVLKQNHATRDIVGAANMPYLETRVLRSLVLKKLLLDKAATLQLGDIDKETNDRIEAVKESLPPGQDFNVQLQAAGLTLDDLKQRVHDAIVVQKVVETEALKNVQPTEQEIDAIYNAHKDAFHVPAMIRASRVLILVGENDTPADKEAKKKQINAARARVINGEDFSKVATDVSQDRSSAPRGGDMGKFPRGTNEAGFDDVAFNTKVNTVSPVFLDSLGYQFIKVTDSEPAGIVSLADARNIIGPKLLEEQQKEKAAEYVQNVLTNSGVTFYLKLVDPPAQMTAPNGPGGPAPDGSSAPPPDQSSGPAPSADSSAPNGSLPSPDLSATNSAPGQ
jgi:foldase protein PrsA